MNTDCFKPNEMLTVPAGDLGDPTLQEGDIGERGDDPAEPGLGIVRARLSSLGVRRLPPIRDPAGSDDGVLVDIRAGDGERDLRERKLPPLCKKRNKSGWRKLLFVLI